MSHVQYYTAWAVYPVTPCLILYTILYTILCIILYTVWGVAVSGHLPQLPATLHPTARRCTSRAFWDCFYPIGHYAPPQKLTARQIPVSLTAWHTLPVAPGHPLLYSQGVLFVIIYCRLLYLLNIYLWHCTCIFGLTLLVYCAFLCLSMYISISIILICICTELSPAGRVFGGTAPEVPLGFPQGRTSSFFLLTAPLHPASCNASHLCLSSYWRAALGYRGTC